MGKRILVVDDDFEISSIMRDTLETAGHQVELCDNGREVMSTISSYKPDLLLLDVMLPGIDGYSLAKEISGTTETMNLPIIVLSALAPSAAMFQRFPQVMDFLNKPFNPADLLDAVEKALIRKP